MKILVTGGCGFVGANICLHLKKRNHNIFSLDNLSRKGSSFNLKVLKKNNIKNFNIDIFNYNKIKKLTKFDLIIDCCAEAAVEVSKCQPNSSASVSIYRTRVLSVYHFWRFKNVCVFSFCVLLFILSPTVDCRLASADSARLRAASLRTTACHG